MKLSQIIDPQNLLFITQDNEIIVYSIYKQKIITNYPFPYNVSAVSQTNNLETLIGTFEGLSL